MDFGIHRDSGSQSPLDTEGSLYFNIIVTPNERADLMKQEESDIIKENFPGSICKCYDCLLGKLKRIPRRTLKKKIYSILNVLYITIIKTI